MNEGKIPSHQAIGPHKYLYSAGLGESLVAMTDETRIRGRNNHRAGPNWSSRRGDAQPPVAVVTTTLLRSRRRGSGMGRHLTRAHVPVSQRDAPAPSPSLTNFPALRACVYCCCHNINHLPVGHASFRPHLLCL